MSLSKLECEIESTTQYTTICTYLKELEELRVQGKAEVLDELPRFPNIKILVKKVEILDIQ